MEEEAIKYLNQKKDGESIMVRRVLYHEEMDQEPFLRKCLYTTRCKVEGNIAK